MIGGKARALKVWGREVKMARGFNQKAIAAKGGVRIGGKGTPRRKQAVNRRNNSSAEDSKLQLALKKLQCNTIRDIQEINLFKKDGTVIHFEKPKFSFSPQCNLYVVTGTPEETPLETLIEQNPHMIRQLAPDDLTHISKNAAEGNAEGDDDEVPDLVADFDQ